jgi:hypothetical protein
LATRRINIHEKRALALTRWLILTVADNPEVNPRELNPDTRLAEIGLQGEGLKHLALLSRRYLRIHHAANPLISSSELAAAETLVGVLSLLTSRAIGGLTPQPTVAGWLRRILEELFPPPKKGSSASTSPQKRRNARRR